MPGQLLCFMKFNPDGTPSFQRMFGSNGEPVCYLGNVVNGQLYREISPGFVIHRDQERLIDTVRQMMGVIPSSTTTVRGIPMRREPIRTFGGSPGQYQFVPAQQRVIMLGRTSAPPPFMQPMYVRGIPMRRGPVFFR